MPGRTIDIKTGRKKIEITLDGDDYCTVSYNPGSELFSRNVARMIQALGELGKHRDIDIPDFADGGEPLDEISQISGTLGGFADAFDAFIEATDKIIGKGITEAILEYDNEDMAILMSVLEPVFEDYAKARGGRLDKYRANPKAVTRETGGAASAIAEDIITAVSAGTPVPGESL